MVQAVIERFEEGSAIMRMPDGAFLTVPRAFLPHNATPGDIISVRIADTDRHGENTPIGGLLHDLWERF